MQRDREVKSVRERERAEIERGRGIQKERENEGHRGCVSESHGLCFQLNPPQVGQDLRGKVELLRKL